jgi:hypothetical protein
MVTLFSYLKSIHGLEVPSLFFTKRIGAPQVDTFGRIYPFFNNSSSCLCNSFNSGVPILYGVLDTRAAPYTKSIGKSMSLFGGNPIISPKISLKSIRTGWSSMLVTLSLVTSSTWATKKWHPFLKLLFNYIVEISLTTKTIGKP